MALFIDRRRSVRCVKCYKLITPEENKLGKGICKDCSRKLERNKRNLKTKNGKSN